MSESSDVSQPSTSKESIRILLHRWLCNDKTTTKPTAPELGITKGTGVVMGCGIFHVCDFFFSSETSCRWVMGRKGFWTVGRLRPDENCLGLWSVGRGCTGCWIAAGGDQGSSGHARPCACWDPEFHRRFNRDFAIIAFGFLGGGWVLCTYVPLPQIKCPLNASYRTQRQCALHHACAEVTVNCTSGARAMRCIFVVCCDVHSQATPLRCSIP